LVFAHRYHISGAPVVENAWKQLHGAGFSHEVAGTYLRRWFGDRLLTIGNLVGAGEVGQDDHREALLPAAGDNLDGLGREVGGSAFALDLRRAPAEVATWLEQEQYLAHGPQEFSVVPMKAFDLLVYVDTITSAYEPSREA
jgi:erythromycin esterase-like protein